jgi:hypothetical protein
MGAGQGGEVAFCQLYIHIEYAIMGVVWGSSFTVIPRDEITIK